MMEHAVPKRKQVSNPCGNARLVLGGCAVNPCRTRRIVAARNHLDVRGRSHHVRYARLAAVCCLAWASCASVLGEQLEFVEVAPQWTTALRLHDSGTPLVAVGVNYFGPHDGWAPKLWQRFDPARVRQHLELVHQQGFNTIRVFLTLDSFHRQPGQVHPEGVAKFRQLLDICRDLEIRVIPSGPDHWEGIPAWLRGQDRFAAEEVMCAEEAWWESFTGMFRDEPVILAWDLLNEPSIGWESPAMRTRWNVWLAEKYGTVEQVAAAHGRPIADVAALGQVPIPAAQAAPGDPQLYDYQLFRESVADQWARRLAEAIRRGDPRHLITIGHIQWASPVYLPQVRTYAAFRLEDSARHVDFVTVHFYPIAPPKPCDDPAGHAHNAAYLEAVLRTCSTGKPVMIGEFAWYGGGAIEVDGRVTMPAQTWEDQLAWNTRLLEVSQGRVCGWLHWAFADTPTSRDLTRWSGLWTEQLELKPWGRAFGQFARQAVLAPAQSRPFPEHLSGVDSDRLTVLTSPGLWFSGGAIP